MRPPLGSQKRGRIRVWPLVMRETCETITMYIFLIVHLIVDLTPKLVNSRGFKFALVGLECIGDT